MGRGCSEVQMIYIVAGAIVVLIANRVGHWLDSLPENKPMDGIDPGWYEWDMTLWGIFIATLAYLIINHLH
jgi:hypothetical protein